MLFVAAAAMHALSDNPPYMLKKLKKLYKMMMAEGFKPTGQLLLTALILIRFHDEREFPAIIKKTKHICLSLKTGPWHEMVVPADQIEAAQEYNRCGCQGSDAAGKTVQTAFRR